MRAAARRNMGQRPAYNRMSRKFLSSAPTDGAAPSAEGMSRVTKYILFGIGGTIVGTSGWAYAYLPSNPELRQQLDKTVPFLMQPLRAVAPIDMDEVTMEDLKKLRSIWYVDDEDEEWGTGYDESMCPASQRARLTMKKGRQFIVDVSPTDTLASLQPKALELHVKSLQLIVSYAIQYNHYFYKTPNLSPFCLGV